MARKNSLKQRLTYSLTGVDWLALAICATFFLFWFNLLLNKYVNFGYYDWDFALYAQAMWNLVHGSAQVSLFGTNFLTNHSNFFAFVLIPVYAVFTHPFTLIVLKLLSFFGGAYVFYMIAQGLIGKKLAALFMFFYICYPPNMYLLLFEFDFESLAILGLFLLFYFFQKEKFPAFAITALAVCLMKENLPSIVCMFGILALFTKRKNKLLWVLVPIVLGAGIFLSDLFLITPYLRAREGIVASHGYLGFYLTNPPNVGQAGPAWLNNAIQLIARIPQPANIRYFQEMFGPLNILPLLSPHILFLCLPILLQNILSTAWQMHTIYFHYTGAITPFIFLAAVNSLSWLRKKNCSPKTYSLIIGITSLVCLLNIISLSRDPRFLARKGPWDNRLTPVRWQMLADIPRDASVVATFNFLPELSTRKSLYSLYKVWMNQDIFAKGTKNYQLPDEVSYALIDWEDAWLWQTVRHTDAASGKQILGRLKKLFLDSNQWSVRQAAENLVLFQKNVPHGLKLVEAGKRPFARSGKPLGLRINDDFELVSCRRSEAAAATSPLLPMTVQWHSRQNVNSIYQMKVSLKRNNQTFYSMRRYIGYGVYPTLLWEKGDYVQERFWLLLPRLAPGEYSIVFSFEDLTNGKIASLSHGRDHKEGNVFYWDTILIK